MPPSAVSPIRRSVRRAVPPSSSRDLAEELNARGNALLTEGQPEPALALYSRAVDCASDLPGVHYNMGNALQQLGRFEEAVGSYQRATALAPGFAEAYNNGGNALRALGRDADAIRCFSRAIELRPHYPEAFYNLGTAQLAAGQVEEAIRDLEQALALAPSFAEAHFNMSLALLLKGDYKQGWAEYEWRWRCAGTIGLPVRQMDRPAWDGADLSGRHLLLHTEQGFGDSIQFVRYAEEVRRKKRPARITLLCEPELERLMQTAPGIDAVVSDPGQCEFDVHAPLLSLPNLLGGKAPLAAPKPYLAAAPPLRTRWRRKLRSLEGLKVGLAWAGRVRTARQRDRALPDDVLPRLMDVPNVTFVSLQHEMKTSLPRIVQLGASLADFADTAAVIAQLDLVISVDTAVAHVAGALGKPVWLLLPRVPNWRWRLSGSRTPWYPSLRLFRQGGDGEWEPVVERVRKALAELAPAG